MNDLFFERWIVFDTIQCVDGFKDGSCLRFYLFWLFLTPSNFPQTKAIGRGNITAL